MSTWPARRAKLMENAENRESAAEHVGTAMLLEVIDDGEVNDNAF